MVKIIKKHSNKNHGEPTTTVADVMGTPLVSLLNIVKKQTVRYGSHTIENRALPDFRDGLKPVFRRVIWTANDEKMYHNGMLKKSARIVGTCIGKYHPHGDVGTYSALVTMVNMPTPLFDGRDFSNWGDPESDAAAMRYTECRLSEITQTYLLDPKYLACVPKVPNYDDTLEEPVYLPSKLPMLLLTGAQGIAMACTTLIPSYSFDSVKSLTKKAIKKGKCTPEMCMDLEFKFTYGGKNTNSEEELLEYYKTGEQKLTFRPNLKIGKNEITVLDLPPNLPASKILSTVSSVEGVKYGKNVHGRGHPEWVEIIPKRKMDSRELRSLAHTIANKYTIGLHAKTLVTQRHDDGTTVTFSRTTIPGIVNSWLEWRISFERKVIEHLIDLERNKLQVNNWLLWALRNRKLVLSSLESNDPKKYLMSKGKISEEHADYVLNLQVRRLAKIEEKDILSKIKENKEIISGLKHDASSDLNLRKRIYADL